MKTQALLIALMVLMLPCVASIADATATIPSLSPFGPFEIPDNAAMELLDKMGVGWNLGNTMDAFSDPYHGNEMDIEKSWTGQMTKEALFIALSKIGYRTVRIPVSWHNHVDDSFRISERWLNRVQTIVDYAYSRGFYVILNTHHDVGKSYYYPLNEYKDLSDNYIRSVWSQLAERFADYDEHLIFESMNEPRMKDTNYEWTFNKNIPDCLEAMENINRLNQLFVDTVRASGGNNANRYLMVPGYAASPDSAIGPYFRIPEDSAENKIIVSVHAYTPYEFALQNGGVSVFSLDNMKQKASITYLMNDLYNSFIKKGIPVVIGEFGARDKAGNLQSRVDYAAFYTVAARSRNIPCVWWDNGAFFGNGELFGILSRSQCTFTYPQIAQAMIKYQDCRIK